MLLHADPEHRPNEDRILILLCTYNEAKNLPTLIPAIHEEVPAAHILVVDDGSPDGTGNWVEQHRASFPLSLLQRNEKLGLGSAIRCGMQWGIDYKFPWILNMDADWSHHPTQLGRLLGMRFVEGRPADLVIGSRYVAGGELIGCSWRRKLVSKSVNILSRMLLGIPLRDFSSAYRCYRSEFLAEMYFEAMNCRGYGFLEEVLFHVHKHGGIIREVPISYEERKLGKSKISWKEAYTTFLTLLRLFKARFRAVENSRAK